MQPFIEVYLVHYYWDINCKACFIAIKNLCPRLMCQVLLSNIPINLPFLMFLLNGLIIAWWHLKLLLYKYSILWKGQWCFFSANKFTNSVMIRIDFFNHVEVSLSQIFLGLSFLEAFLKLPVRLYFFIIFEAHFLTLFI